MAAGYVSPVYKSRIAKGLCKLCGVNPIDHEKRSKNGSTPTSATCSSCRDSKYKTYKDRPYQSAEKGRDHYVIVKRAVFEKYGGKCEKCGEDRWECLSIDHVNQDGKQDRADNPRTSKQWFLRLNREPRRSDLRVLCMSCNWSIAMWGYAARDPSRPPQDSFEEAVRKYREKWVRRRTPNVWCS